MASTSLSLSFVETAPVPTLSVGQQQAIRLLPELGVLVTASLLCMTLFSVGEYEAVSLLGPVVLILVTAVANFRMVVADPAMLMTPLFGIRLTALVVFGGGALFDMFSPLEEQLRRDSLYAASVEEVARTNLLWLLSMTMLLAGVALAMRFHRRSRAEPPAQDKAGAVPLTIGLWMFALSFAFITSKIILSIVTPIILPGILENFVLAFELCGMFLVAQHVGTSRVALFAVWVGMAAVILSSLLFTSKTLALYPALMAMLGLLSKRMTWRRALAGAALIMLIFVVIAPIVTYSRDRIEREHGLGGSASISERWSYIVDYAGGDRLREDTIAFTLSRLDYVMPASFVMSQHDQGLPSDDLATAAFIFVPRLIWPDKPSTTDSGLEVNHLLGSQTTNQIGVTVFAHLYWSIGWYALVIAFVMGIYSGIVSLMCHAIIRRGDWLLIPFALSAMRTGLNLDDDFTGAWLAPAVINLIMYFALTMAGRLLPRLAGGSPGSLVSVPR
ncbi:MAG: hypothetical protein ABIO85_07100 [Sphingomicrobium sp.]